jgi:hypothetical protein
MAWGFGDEVGIASKLGVADDGGCSEVALGVGQRIQALRVCRAIGAQDKHGCMMCFLSCYKVKIREDWVNVYAVHYECPRQHRVS